MNQKQILLTKLVLLTKFDGSKEQDFVILMNQNNKISYFDESNLLFYYFVTFCNKILLLCYFVVLMDQKQNSKILGLGGGRSLPVQLAPGRASLWKGLEPC